MGIHFSKVRNHAPVTPAQPAELPAVASLFGMLKDLSNGHTSQVYVPNDFKERLVATPDVHPDTWKTKDNNWGDAYTEELIPKFKEGSLNEGFTASFSRGRCITRSIRHNLCILMMDQPKSTAPLTRMSLIWKDMDEHLKHDQLNGNRLLLHVWLDYSPLANRQPKMMECTLIKPDGTEQALEVPNLEDGLPLFQFFQAKLWHHLVCNPPQHTA